MIVVCYRVIVQIFDQQFPAAVCTFPVSSAHLLILFFPKPPRLQGTSVLTSTLGNATPTAIPFGNTGRFGPENPV